MILKHDFKKHFAHFAHFRVCDTLKKFVTIILAFLSFNFPGFDGRKSAVLFEQEAVRQVRGMKRPVPCYDLLAAAFNTIEAVKRAGKKNEILRWYDEEKHRSMI